ncbi:MAG TPA: MmgE/PrpD family protein [Stellaceae bacterium]|jgi:2-methylcitrate dehydratase PrpD|nr:MmgE/PrpD family protein [Stellaceae bacterium]
MAGGQRVTEQLAQFLASSRWEDLPEPVRREAVRGLLNFVGGALGGSIDEAMGLTIKVLTPFFGPAQATFIGHRARPDMLNAAYLNGMAANVLEYDDTHLPTVMHAGAPAAPGILALAEQRRLTGAQLLHAFVLGLEAECRVGLSVMPNHYRRGKHITASCGIFGGAVASAKLLGLDAAGMARALGHAATQSAGLVESLGSMSKCLGVGGAGRNGLASALFAEAGFTAAEQPIEGRFGFAAANSETVDLAAITDGLGERWTMLDNAYKPYPCGVVLFPVVDACLTILARDKPPLDRIGAIQVHGHPLLRERTDRPNIDSGRLGKVSLQHTVAAVFVRGRAGLAEYTDECVADPAVRALRAKVRAADDETIPPEAAVVTVRLTDGSVLMEHVRHSRGTPGRPMTDAELDAKVTELAAAGAPFVDVPALIAAVRALPDAPDAASFLKLTVPPA